MKRKLLVAAGILAALVAVAGILVAVFVKPEAIKQQALARIRAATDYRVEAGPAELHLGWHGAGVRVHEILLAAPDSSQIVTVDELDLFVKLFPLLRKRVELAQVTLRRPVYRLTETTQAEARKPESASPGLAFLAVQSWSVVDGSYQQHAAWGDLRLEALDLSGGLVWRGEAGGEGDVQGTVGGGSFRGAAGFWPVPELRASLGFRVSGGMDSLHVDPVDVRSGPLHAQLHGDYAQGTRGWWGTLRGAVDPVAWTDLRAWLPDTLTARLGAVDLKGTLALPELTIVSRDSTFTSGALTFSNVEAQVPQAPLGISGASGTVRFDPDKIVLESTRAMVGEDSVRVFGQVDFRARPILAATIGTHLSATNLAKLLPPGAPITLRSGEVAVDLHAGGMLPLDGLPDLAGWIRLTGIEGTYGTLPLRDLKGRIHFHGAGATLDRFEAGLGRSDFALKGEVDDVSKPWFRFDLTSRLVDLNELMPEEKPGKAKAAPAEPAPAVGLPGEGTVALDELRVRKLTIRDARARARLDMDGVQLSDMQGKAYGGTVTGDLTLRPVGSEGRWRYEGALQLTDVGAGPVLMTWTGLADQLSGAVSGTLKLSGIAGGSVDPRTLLDLTGNLSMKSGSLLNNPDLKDIGTTFGLSQLTGAQWPFHGMDLKFQVKQGAIQVQGLSFTQPGLGWSLGGSVGLDGKLGLNGVLRVDPNKVTLPTELALARPLLVEGDGRIPIDFTFGGTLENPSVNLDMKALMNRATERLKESQKESFQKTLKQAVPDSTFKKLNNFLKKRGGGG